MRRPRNLFAAAGAVAAASVVTLALLTPPAVAADSVSVEILSSRADSVSGGDALVAVTGAAGEVRVTAAGVDVSSAFVADEGRLIGLVEGLPLGSSDIVVETADSGSAEVEVVNHPLSGPVFSGPQHPMYCTASGAPWNFGELDADCQTDQTFVTYRYRTTAGAFADFPTNGTRPTDLATAQVDGVDVPYIVRIERGTVNRAVYETAILHDPATAAPSPTTDLAGWTGKLAYTFGGACGVGYWQGTSTGGVENDLLLRNGYAVASATLNVYAQNCNDVTSAETAMMVKEKFIETHGAVRFTMGSGGSAGTMQQLLLANNYPGILDGVLGEIGYPDERTTTIGGHDCRGLQNYWGSTAGAGWTDAQKLAVSGHAVTGTCFGFTFFDGVDDPNRGCAAAVPVADRWSPTNPDGLRCTIADMVKNVYGVDEQGRGLRVEPDNVGVQYGLDAVENGEISVEQFLSLNQNIGGMNVDGVRTAERSVASVEAIERAFETGRVNMMTGGLETIPVLEIRGYSDLRGDFHERYRSAIIRERMLEAHGNADTHVNWTSPEGAVNTLMREQAFAYLDAWLEGIEELGGPADRARTVQARPAELEDGCFDAGGTFIEEELDYSDPTTACNTLYPYHSEPRYEAGEPLLRDVLKCEVTDPVRADYPTMTDEQWAQLNTVFADGVCDWTQPSQGYAELEGTWLNFGETEQVALEPPVITGEPRVGSPLSATAVTEPADATATYEWLLDGVVVAGVTGSTFTPPVGSEGQAVTVRVTASAPGLIDRSAVSAATGPVAAAVTTSPSPSTDPSPSASPTADGDDWAVILGATTVEQGGTLPVTVVGLEPGQTIEATLFSDPIVVTGIPAAGADGSTRFSIAIPADFDLGAHTLVVTAAGDGSIRVTVTVVASGSLASTGSTAPWGFALLGAGLLTAGGLAFALRRRARTSGGVTTP
ncbi:DUF6351 family protein [Microbacterium sp. P04]|uniref:DUF6351 family protein n=1 Tax=Microbacterium sp. P04 TaxID=3366947 RepID=UPI003747364C